MTPEAIAAAGRWIIATLRGYPPLSVNVDLELSDRHCDWNGGRWRVVIEEGDGSLQKGGNGDVDKSIANRLASGRRPVGGVPAPGPVSPAWQSA